MTDEAIAAAAAHLPAAARAAFLDAACAADPDRRARVERLLDPRLTAHAPADTPPAGADPAATDLTRVSDGSRPSAAADGVSRLFGPPTEPDALGRLAHYQVLGELGRGGFGVVVKAFDERLRRTVAIKVLAPPFAASAAARARFVGEARAAAAVHHDHVVGVHAVSADDEPNPYFVMEFVAGETLQQRVARAGPLSVDEVVRVGTEVASGLAAAHARGLIHRDIKPANVLLEEGTGRARITDFGLARAADELAHTVTGGLAGTPAYMSPEQARGERLDARTDLFSLGSLLYAMCTGGPPFRADAAAALVAKVAFEPPPPVRAANPKVPPWLAAVIERLHARDPNDRPASAAEVAAALRAGPAALGPAARHWKPEWRSSAPAKGRGRSWAAAGGALLIILVGVGVLTLGTNAPMTLSPIDPGIEPHRGVPPPPPPPPEVGAPPMPEILTSPDWEWGPPESLGPGVNTAAPEQAATLTADERELIFVRGGDLWRARRGGPDEQFAAPAERLPRPDGTDGALYPTLTGDGLLLAFAPTTTGMNRGVWVRARAARDEPFGPADPLPEPVNVAEGTTFEPVLSADGLTLLVTQFAADGLGRADVVRFTRPTRRAPFAGGAVVGAPVSSPEYDAAAWVSDDGRVLVRTKKVDEPYETRFHVRGARPEVDLAYGPPQPFAVPGVAGELGRPWLSADGRRLYFHSREPAGGVGDLDLWVTRRVARVGAKVR